MKNLQLIAVLLFVNYCTAQTYTFDGQGHLIGGSHIQLKPHISYILKDSITSTQFILDTNPCRHTDINVKMNGGREANLPEFP